MGDISSEAYTSWTPGVSTPCSFTSPPLLCSKPKQCIVKIKHDRGHLEEARPNDPFWEPVQSSKRQSAFIALLPVLYRVFIHQKVLHDRSEFDLRRMVAIIPSLIIPVVALLHFTPFSLLNKFLISSLLATMIVVLVSIIPVHSFRLMLNIRFRTPVSWNHARLPKTSWKSRVVNVSQVELWARARLDRKLIDIAL